MPPENFLLPENHVPREAWMLRITDPPANDRISVKSFIFGVGGLASGLFLMAFILPLVGSFLLSDWDFDDQLGSRLLVNQFVAGPLLAMFALCTVAPVLWHGSVMIRFAAAIAAIAIPCLILIEFYDQTSYQVLSDALLAGAGIFFFACAAVAIFYQWWTPWSLSPFCSHLDPIRPMGIRAIIELTFVVAIGCVIVGTNRSEEIATIFLISSVAGVMLGAIAIMTSHVLLQRRRVKRSYIAALVTLSFIVTFLGNALMAFSDSNSNRFTRPSFEEKSMAAFSYAVLGCVLLLFTLWFGTKWLKACGWQFICRRELAIDEYPVGAYCLTPEERRKREASHYLADSSPLRDSKSFPANLETPISAWVLHLFDLPKHALVSRTSFMSGLLGIAFALFFVGGMLPILMEIVESIYGTRLTYVVQMLVAQSLGLPVFILLCLATTAAMFWYGSLTMRFGMALLMVVPGFLTFLFSMSLFQNVSDIPSTMSSVLLAQLLAGATVAILIQFWTPWTLTHLRDADSPLPSTGIQSMIELTAIAAVSFTLFKLIDVIDLYEGLIFFAVVGVLGTSACTRAMIVFLSKEKCDRRAIVLAMLVAYFLAFAFNGFFAVAEFGWDSIRNNVIQIALLALYGAAILFGTVWVTLAWLSGCGWQCVNRRKSGV
ncbi:hypothetical protein Q31b_53750 [Novipirellula aureliae]|uniref:Uncharacterized protein n=1 Tax=Novipirellula aureliae TaxID=2527966 RepID=A0A5C6DK85_9BACT|nr:hypothetical protein [Novipirellula aureliae]TWU35279.1 hypothetical protein Q31b_53750 [Novipirellula aureliae]